MTSNPRVTEYIQNAPEEQRFILDQLRALIHKAVSEVDEDVKWGIPVFTKTKIFTYLRSTKKHVALGIYNIEKINDENGILQGTGKQMKHLKFETSEDIDEQLIIEWLKITAI